MKFAAFDLETRGTNSEWVCGAVYSDQVRESWTDPADWLAAMKEHAQAGYTLLAHNAEYDVVNGLWRTGQDVTMHYYNGVLTTAYWFWHPRRPSAQIWDTLNLAAGVGLAELGRALRLPKYSMPRRLLDPEDVRPDWVCEVHGVNGCLACYNLRDAEIVYTYARELEAFLAGHGIEMRRTLAGCAVALWQKWDPDRQQTVRSGKIRDLAAAALHGGRVECFMYGEPGGVYTHDIRSHYAQVMLSSPMPDCRYLIYAEGWPRSVNLEACEGVVDAEVYQPPTHVPTLPAVPLTARARGKDPEGKYWAQHGLVAGDRLYYPVGVFRGAWAICELRAALAQGAELRRIHRMAWTDRLLYPFTGYQGGLMVLRREARLADDPREAVYKTLQNALQGRLGMVDGGERRIYRRRTPGLKPKDREGAELHYANDSAYLVKGHQVPRPPSTSNVVWAANITARGRLGLLPHLEAAGGSLVYCDTDSVFSTAPLPTVDDRPGHLRDTGYYSSGLFLSPKHYRLEDRLGNKVLKSKGIPAAFAEAYLETGEVRYGSAVGVIRAINQNLEPGTWIEVPRARALTPARRVLENPRALAERGQLSVTSPVVFGAEGPELPAERTPSST